MFFSTFETNLSSSPSSSLEILSLLPLQSYHIQIHFIHLFLALHDTVGKIHLNE